MVGKSIQMTRVTFNPNPSPTKKYTLEDLQQLRVLGYILLTTRENYDQIYHEHFSLQNWADLLKNRSGVEYSRATIRRYEKAGEPIDARSFGSRSVPKEYLQIVAPLTAYPIDWLLELSRCEYYLDLPAEETPSLSELMESMWESKNESSYKSLCKRYALNDENIELAEKNILRDRDHLASLMGFLDLPPEDICVAAIEGIRQKFPLNKLEEEEVGFSEKTRLSKIERERKRQEKLALEQRQREELQKLADAQVSSA